jgi:translation initiation factor IF-2
LAFGVVTTPVAQEMIQNTGVVFTKYRIIYDLIDYIKEELEKLLNPTITVIELGNFKVMQIFRSDKKMMILGGRVESGKLEKDAKVRVKRNGNIVGDGKLVKLQTAKQEVKSIPQGTEGGVQFEGKMKVEEGDVLEAYKEETKAKKLVLN